VYLEHLLRASIIRDHKDIGLLANANLVSDRVCALPLHERVQGQIIEATVGQPVSVIWARSATTHPREIQKPTFCVLDFRNQAGLGQSADGLVYATGTPQSRYLRDQRCWDDFVVLAAHFDGGQDSPVFVGQVS
jgi:hypothetical protein